MNRTTILFSLFLLAALPLASVALAHGGHGHASTEHAITVTFSNDAGAPLAGLTSRVHGPDGQRYLAGQTDPLGRVVFLPDQPGTWTVKAMSEEGHGGTVRVEVGEDLQMADADDGYTHGAEDTHGHTHDHEHGQVDEHGHEHEHAQEAAAADGGGLTFAAALGYLLGAFGVVALILSRKRPGA